MAKDFHSNEEKTSRVHKPTTESSPESLKDDNQVNPPLADLQQLVGNQAVQRLLAQRTGDEAAELDDETETQINSARHSGQPIDESVQEQMSDSFGVDFSGVRAHTSAESNSLNQQLGSKAFTTGQDVFFRDGAYDPHSSGGKELIAHELTHVVQQSSGAVSSGGDGMRVNPPGDAYEQEADAVAKTTLEEEPETAVQRQEMPEEELQMQSIQRQEEEEEFAQMKSIQRQEMPEEELQMQSLQRQEEEEEFAQMQAIQRQEMPEEELQMQFIQRQEEEEEFAQMQAIQRQEEEEVMMQIEEEEEEALQMQPLEEEEEMLQPKRDNS